MNDGRIMPASFRHWVTISGACAVVVIALSKPEAKTN